MGAPNSSKVSASTPLATGGVLVAPYGTTLPPETAPTGSVTINSAFTALGYMDQSANVSNAENTSSSDYTAWGGDTVLTLVTSRKEQYTLTAVEQNMEVWKLRYGRSNVIGESDANAVVIHDGASFDEYWSLIVAEKLGDGRIHYTVVPKAKLESVGEVSHSDSSPIMYGMTFVALPYSTGSAKTSYEIYCTPPETTTTTS